MPNADSFRILSLTIEGFKGFTYEKTIDFNGRHIFLLGNNGNGKSSIVEAIRWGLFGSINRPNEVVTNFGYVGECRVTLKLRRGNGIWNLRRTLLHGVGGSSDAVLTDDNGREHNIRDVIPSLESADTGEGTHIISSSQSLPLRRQPTDLTPFQRTVLNHIGLLRAQSFDTHLRNFLSDQETTEAEFSSVIQDHQERLDRDEVDLDEELERILQAPPWGSGSFPTIDESKGRAIDLIYDIAGTAKELNVSLDVLIESAEESLIGKQNDDLDVLKTRLSEIEDRIAKYGEAVEIIREVKAQDAAVQAVTAKLGIILNGGISYEDLQRRVNEEKRDLDVLTIRDRIVSMTKELLARDDEAVGCPVCAAEYSHDVLTVHLKSQEGALRETHDEAQNRYDQLEDQLKQAGDLVRRREIEQSRLSILRGKMSAARDLVHADDLGRLANEDSSDQRLRDERDGIREQIEGNQSRLREWAQRLSSLKDERKVHDIEKRRRYLEERRNDFNRIKKSYDHLVSFGESVRKIRQAVNQSFMECLTERLPTVSEQLSNTFAELTRHQCYDKVDFDMSRLPNLDLQVFSSQDAHHRPHPPSVLNGQAESALELVPQFTFGRIEGNTQVHLMMLDDPTRAFDEDHIKKLVERLAEQGKHVQLVVASQESERFKNLLPDHFEEDNYMVITPTNWTYKNGPDLSIDHPK